jgi:ELWxxDGT repeat protein
MPFGNYRKSRKSNTNGAHPTLRLEPLEDRLLLSLTPQLLRDINPGSASSSPTAVVDVNGTAFFTANDNAHGPELWMSNGTPAGTHMVKDIDLGSTGSNPEYLTNVNGTLFFEANNGVSGPELWRSNGTPQGTVLVKDIALGSLNGRLLGSYPHQLTNVNGTLFFAAETGSTGWALWKSDGTAAGTTMVKDVSVPSWPMANVNGTLFFAANNLVSGWELWRSNGATAGTFLVRDINPGAADSRPSDITNVSGKVFFYANDGKHGRELWRSDGTGAGTVMLKDINPGPNGSYSVSSDRLINVNGTLFFAANNGVSGDELWKSNGTTAGTVLVRDIYPGNNGSFPRYMANMNGTLFFSADTLNNVGLWRSNGTAAGTTEIALFPIADPHFMTNVNGTLFFSATSQNHGFEIWQSNGIAAGSKELQAINPAAQLGSQPMRLVNVHGRLFFDADDGTHGRELYALVPVPASTLPATTISLSSAPNPVSVTGASADQKALASSAGMQPRTPTLSPGTTRTSTDSREARPAPRRSKLVSMSAPVFDWLY